MANSGFSSSRPLNRRNRLHELLIALIHQNNNLELMNPESSLLDQSSNASKDYDPASWLDRNRRILETYQALVRSAVTLDSLLDAEETSSI